MNLEVIHRSMKIMRPIWRKKKKKLTGGLAGWEKKQNKKKPQQTTRERSMGSGDMTVLGGDKWQ